MKKRICVAALAAAAVLTGCGVGIPDLSDEDGAVISQYMADLLLRHDAGYANAFEYDRTVLEPTPIPTPTPAPAATAAPAAGQTAQTQPGTGAGAGSESSSGLEGGGGGTGNGSGQQAPALNAVSFNELVNISGVDIKPLNCKAKKNIVTGYSSISADRGKKLVVVSFRIKNSSSSPVKVNLKKKKIEYSLTVGGTSCGAPLNSIAQGDMQYFNEEVLAGQSKKGVLIFQTDSSTKLKNPVLRASKGNKESETGI